MNIYGKITKQGKSASSLDLIIKQNANCSNGVKFGDLVQSEIKPRDFVYFRIISPFMKEEKNKKRSVCLTQSKQLSKEITKVSNRITILRGIFSSDKEQTLY